MCCMPSAKSMSFSPGWTKIAIWGIDWFAQRLSAKCKSSAKHWQNYQKLNQKLPKKFQMSGKSLGFGMCWCMDKQLLKAARFMKSPSNGCQNLKLLFSSCWLSEKKFFGLEHQTFCDAGNLPEYISNRAKTRFTQF